MTKQQGKELVVPLEVEFERLSRLLSEKEKTANPRLVKKLGKLKAKLAQLREMLSPNPMTVMEAF